jgi:biofilm PGA synthesis N-glycosyltransferase PgaC
MEIIKIILWISIFFVLYSYIGYALMIWMYLKIWKKTPGKINSNNPPFEPPVSLVVAVYNEEDVLKKK